MWPRPVGHFFSPGPNCRALSTARLEVGPFDRVSPDVSFRREKPRPVGVVADGGFAVFSFNRKPEEIAVYGLAIPIDCRRQSPAASARGATALGPLMASGAGRREHARALVLWTC